mmetsp:Transcript_17891/g.51514  ORF Transcript_17891/g.51514 Transcript_17891/m.51514 type:complete len:403 (-) Transcript_17891:2358-3566(-)
MESRGIDGHDLEEHPLAAPLVRQQHQHPAVLLHNAPRERLGGEEAHLVNFGVRLQAGAEAAHDPQRRPLQVGAVRARPPPHGDAVLVVASGEDLPVHLVLAHADDGRDGAGAGLGRVGREGAASLVAVHAADVVQAPAIAGAVRAPWPPDAAEEGSRAEPRADDLLPIMEEDRLGGVPLPELEDVVGDGVGHVDVALQECGVLALGVRIQRHEELRAIGVLGDRRGTPVGSATDRGLLHARRRRLEGWRRRPLRHRPLRRQHLLGSRLLHLDLCRAVYSRPRLRQPAAEPDVGARGLLQGVAKAQDPAPPRPHAQVYDVQHAPKPRASEEEADPAHDVRAGRAAGVAKALENAQLARLHEELRDSDRPVPLRNAEGHHDACDELAVVVALEVRRQHGLEALP